MPEKKETEKEQREDSEREIRRMKEQRDMYGPTAKPPLLRRMTNMQGGPSSRAMIKTMKMLQKDVKEMKSYLKEILDYLKSEKK